MPMTMSVYDAKLKFSRVLSEVEEKRESVTILRYGHPIAQIVPLQAKARSLTPDPELAGKIKVNCDLFADPFYCEANMKHLRDSAAEARAGHVTEHDLIEA